MTITSTPRFVDTPSLVTTASATLHDGRVEFAAMGRRVDLHPNWLRDRSQEPGQVEATNRQRLFTPRDLPVLSGLLQREIVYRLLTGEVKTLIPAGNERMARRKRRCESASPTT